MPLFFHKYAQFNKSVAVFQLLDAMTAMAFMEKMEMVNMTSMMRRNLILVENQIN